MYFAAIELRVSDKTTRVRYGQVRVRYKGVWGTVGALPYKWGINEATAACKDKGFEFGIPHGNQPWGYSTEVDNPVLLFGVSCANGTSSLKDCDHQGWAAQKWSHQHDVGVTCYNSNTADGKITSNMLNDLKVLCFYTFL